MLLITAATFRHSEKLPMGDSVILRQLTQKNAVIWTQGVKFERITGVKLRRR